jgi:hypothetical protein
MAVQTLILLLINIIGGLAVLGSYIQGILAHPGGGNALWGGISKAARPFYGISMILAALGYFAFMYFILLKLNPDEVQIAGRFSFNLLYFIFLGILIPSVLWMPLTYYMVNNPGSGVWMGVRLVLMIVGLFSCTLVWAILTLNTREPNLSYWLAAAGSAYFAFHTAILDMIVWPFLFRF